MITPQAVVEAQLALKALYAEDAFDSAHRAGADTLRVAPDARLAPHWNVLGRITAIDAAFRIGPITFGSKRCFYGWHLVSATDPKSHLAVVRGTETIYEWIIDGEMAPRKAHHIAGEVETGFYDLYCSMRYWPNGGNEVPLLDLVKGLPPTATLTIVGHSLGAALAELFTFDAAAIAGDRVTGMFIAAPRVGDNDFRTVFARRVSKATRGLAYERDIVPRVPAGFGYEPLLCEQIISTAGLLVEIADTVAASHHALSYAALRNPNVLKSFVPIPLDIPFLRAITIL